MFGNLSAHQSQHQHQAPTINVVHQNGYNNYLNGSSLGRIIEPNGQLINASQENGGISLLQQQQQNLPQWHQQQSSEKISDIYVNRNANQMYGPLMGNKPTKTILLYDDNDYGSSYKGFYLHNPKRVENSGTSDNLLGDSKIYNAFSKQRLPYGNDRHGMESIQYQRTSAVQKAKRTPLQDWGSHEIMEDDELSNILG